MESVNPKLPDVRSIAWLGREPFSFVAQKPILAAFQLFVSALGIDVQSVRKRGQRHVLAIVASDPCTEYAPVTVNVRAHSASNGSGIFRSSSRSAWSITS